MNDYNGVSLSTVSRSNVMVNPSCDQESKDYVPEAKEVADWFARQGGQMEWPHCGEGLANNGRSSLGGAGGAGAQRQTVQSLREKPAARRRHQGRVRQHLRHASAHSARPDLTHGGP